MTARPDYQSPGTSLALEARALFGRRILMMAVVLVAVGSAAVAVVIVLRALGAASFSGMVTDVSTLSPPQIESIGRFKFPPGARGIRSRYVSWMDFTLHVSFTLPPKEVDSLLRTTQIPQPLSTTEIPFQLSGSDGWWTPGVPSSFEAGTNSPNSIGSVDGDDETGSGAPTSRPEVRQFILIDKSNPLIYRVWILVSG
jgi:hypothetical protein